MARMFATTRPGSIKRRPRAGDYVRLRSADAIYLVVTYHGGRHPYVDVEPAGGGPLTYFAVSDVEVLSRSFVRQAL